MVALYSRTHRIAESEKKHMADSKMNRLEKKPPPEFRYSAKGSANPRIPEPIENIDYFKADKFDCIVCFEIHVSAHEEEDNQTIESRAYEAIKAGQDFECLGVMMKERDGTVKLDELGKEFNESSWTKKEHTRLKTIRKEPDITSYTELP